MSTLFYYSRLDEKQRKIYDVFHEGVKNLRQSITLPQFGIGPQPDDLMKIFTYMILDHPELSYVNMLHVSKRQNLIKGALIPEYLYPPHEIGGIIDRFNRECNEIIKPTLQMKSNYEKIKYIHDYICTNITYGYLDIPDVGLAEALSQNAYTGILNRKIVCMGISMLFKTLADRAGLYCIIVKGAAKIGEHAWVIVSIDGALAHIEITRDVGATDIYSNDVGSKAEGTRAEGTKAEGSRAEGTKAEGTKAEGSRAEGSTDSYRDINYSGFLLTDNEMDGFWWNRELYPPCTVKPKDLFEREGAVVNNVRQLEKLVGEYAESGRRAFHFKIPKQSPFSIKARTEVAAIVTRVLSEKRVSYSSITYKYDDTTGKCNIVVQD